MSLIVSSQKVRMLAREKFGRFSTTVTWNPSSASSHAARSPTGPAPHTRILSKAKPPFALRVAVSSAVAACVAELSGSLDARNCATSFWRRSRLACRSLSSFLCTNLRLACSSAGLSARKSRSPWPRRSDSPSLSSSLVSAKLVSAAVCTLQKASHSSETVKSSERRASSSPETPEAYVSVPTGDGTAAGDPLRAAAALLSIKRAILPRSAV
mmetsp:Transcript_72916/g.144941  ORF Transcript_72916/g.144941 Transcript_72916/m.144941 type:complete len:212 (+) Transcript_72916:1652-2287(+)